MRRNNDSFLALLLMIIGDKVTDVLKDNTIGPFIYIAAISFIAIASPIVSILSIIRYGFESAFHENSFFIITAFVELVTIAIIVIKSYVSYKKALNEIKNNPDKKDDIKLKIKSDIKNEIGLAIIIEVILLILILFPIILVIEMCSDLKQS